MTVGSKMLDPVVVAMGASVDGVKKLRIMGDHVHCDAAGEQELGPVPPFLRVGPGKVLNRTDEAVVGLNVLLTG